MAALRRVALLALAAAARGWRLRWADEFDGDSLNASLWRAAANDSEAPPRWNQVECYTPSNVAVHDGALWLTARLENTTCGRHSGPTYNVTSGKVDSRSLANATFPLRIEVRARLQNGWAYGLHSAAWLVGYECDPMTSEIDVFEFEVEPSTNPACVKGTFPNAPSCWVRRSANYHYGTQCGVDLNKIGGGTFPSAPIGTNPVNFSATFRVFSAEVNATHALYYDEGENGEEKTLVTSFYKGMPKWPDIVLPSWDMYVILSHAYMATPLRRANGPDWIWGADSLATTHTIDYVRVYGAV